MEIAKLTSKGQLTLPISIRRQLGLDCGDKVAFVEKDGEYLLVNVNRLAVQSKKVNSVKVDNVIATMQMEGLEVSEESIDYMKNRAMGRITIEERISQIKDKYNRN
ncbi:MAG: AbrB/MazE/SpoVT family DNA-binding domain-containing protein [Clostridia bacterium]|nr:AbrB/MazE/SpoVT family DNA-binding domain-containing protein [Clostridia bacterium]